MIRFFNKSLSIRAIVLYKVFISYLTKIRIEESFLVYFRTVYCRIRPNATYSIFIHKIYGKTISTILANEQKSLVQHRPRVRRKILENVSKMLDCANHLIKTGMSSIIRTSENLSRKNTEKIKRPLCARHKKYNLVVSRFLLSFWKKKYGIILCSRIFSPDGTAPALVFLWLMFCSYSYFPICNLYFWTKLSELNWNKIGLEQYRADFGRKSSQPQIYSPFFVENFVKNWKSRQKLKSSSKIENLVKNWKFRQKLKSSSKIENLVKNWKFRQKLKISSQIENFVKNWKFRHKLKISLKIENFVKNWKFRQILKISSKIENFVKNWKFRQK